MSVKPAIISIKPEARTFTNQIPPNGIFMDVTTEIGIISEKRIQGKNTQISKGRLI